MNREILFKAKRTDNGEWVEGYYAIAEDSRGLKQHYIFVSDRKYGYFEWVVIDKKTLCQYTELTDMHGNNIWENDIVKVHSFIECAEGYGNHRNEVGVICYDSIGMLSLRIGLCDGKPCYSDIFQEIVLAGTEYEFESIGNIFDNPELIGGAS